MTKRPAPDTPGAGLDAWERAGTDTLCTSSVPPPVADASGVLPLAGAIESFLFHCRYEKNLSAKTLAAYGTDLRQFAEHVADPAARASVAAIDKHVLRGWIVVLSERFGEESTRRKVATLRAFFGYLEREDTIVVNPLRKLSIRLRRTRRLPRTIPLDELRALFRHLYHVRNLAAERDLDAALRDIAILELLFATAARVSEVAHLRVADIDLQQATVRVLGKGRRERVLPLSGPSPVQAVRDYLAAAPPFSSGDYLFRNRRNHRFTEASIRRMIRVRSEEAGIERKVTPHMFRHSVATMLLEEGVDIRLIQTVLGHASVATTQIYTAVHDAFRHRVLAERHPRRRL